MRGSCRFRDLHLPDRETVSVVRLERRDQIGDLRPGVWLAANGLQFLVAPPDLVKPVRERHALFLRYQFLDHQLDSGFELRLDSNSQMGVFLPQHAEVPLVDEADIGHGVGECLLRGIENAQTCGSHLFCVWFASLGVDPYTPLVPAF